MRKSVLFIVFAALVSVVALPAKSRAQMLPQLPQLPQYFDGKLLVNFNLGIQVGDNDLSRQSTFDLYDETATVDISQTINNGFFFEIGGAYKYRPNYGFGLVYGYLSNSGDARVNGSLPHPQLFDQPRSFSVDVDDIPHSEHSWHFQAVYFMPFTEKVDFMFSGGPSIFSVNQGLVRGVSFSETGPPFTSVTIDSVDVPKLGDTGWGFNLGADMTYAVSPTIGVGALIRYTHGGVEFNLSDSQTAEVTAGGFQLGAGVRLKF
jgi:Outer membrane protein beta-barrel domain